MEWNVTQRQIYEASLEMESQMKLHELQASLKELRENLEYLHVHAKTIAFPTYQKIKAAEQAALAAIERIMNTNEKEMLKKPKHLQRLRFRKGIGKPSKERSRACLRMVCSRC